MLAAFHEAKREAVFGAERDRSHDADGPGARPLEAPAGEPMGENGERLGAGEAGADADAGTAAEGDVLEAMEADLAFGQKAVGVEGIGIVPQLLVEVDDPRPYGEEVAAIG